MKIFIKEARNKIDVKMVRTSPMGHELENSELKRKKFFFAQKGGWAIQQAWAIKLR